VILINSKRYAAWSPSLYPLTMMIYLKWFLLSRAYWCL